MIFMNPMWLLMIIPVFAFYRYIFPTENFANRLRIAAAILVIIALSGITLSVTGNSGTVIVIADRSMSMPAECQALQEEMIAMMESQMKSNHNLGVISFGEKAFIEHAPQNGKFPGFQIDTGRNASSLGNALEMALSVVSKNDSVRMIILSDGQWTGENPQSTIPEMITRNISVDYRLLKRSSVNDLSVFDIESADQVSPGQSFMITAWIQSPENQTISVKLIKNKAILYNGSRAIQKGLNKLLFRDTADNPGTLEYVLEIIGSGIDPVPENNRYRFLLSVSGVKPVLIVSESENSALRDILRGSQVEAVQKKSSECSWTLADLSGHSAVILQDIPARSIGTEGMENISEWIRHTPGGLMMTGGKNSFGPGGYYKSPLEKVMPVTMELRKEHRKLSLAIVIVADRSGSMGMAIQNGRTKMDLANVASAGVLDMLSSMDEFGMLAVDTKAHTIVPLNPVDKAKSYRPDILGIRSEGGGIYVYTGLLQAVSLLDKANASTKHVILFADAADSEEPGKYIDLLSECSRSNITVSVVALGTPADQDSRFLEDVARRGNGRIFYTTSAEDLPRLFAQDTLVVSKNSFIDEATKVKGEAGLLSLTTIPYRLDAEIGGYNLCYLRPEGNRCAVTTDEYKSPFIANWQPGAGRVLCYTGQIDGKYTGNIVSWPELGSFITSLVKWTAGSSTSPGADMLIEQKLKNGIINIRLYLDPERKTTFLEPEVITLSGKPGSKPALTKNKMAYLNPDVMELNINMENSNTYLSTFTLQDGKKLTLPPKCLPYSPEFRPYPVNRGREALQQISEATNGKERINLSQIWDDLPYKKEYRDISGWFLIAAVILFLLEILQRRTRMPGHAADLVISRIYSTLSHLAKSRSHSTAPPAPETRETSPRTKTIEVSEPVLTEPVIPDTPAEKKPEVKPENVLSSLKKAKNSAARKFDKSQ